MDPHGGGDDDGSAPCCTGDTGYCGDLAHGCGEAADVSPFDICGAADSELQDSLALLLDGEDADPACSKTAVWGEDSLVQVEFASLEDAEDGLLRDLLPNDTSDDSSHSRVSLDTNHVEVTSMDRRGHHDAFERDGAAGRVGEKQPTDRNPTRRRVKSELEYLRQRVSELQEELGHLQQQRKDLCCEHFAHWLQGKWQQNIYPFCVRFIGAMIGTATAALTSAAGTLSTTAIPKPSSNGAAWKGIAERQRVLRQKVELDNVKLKDSLVRQLRLARSLEKLLHKRPSLWTNDALHSKRSCNARRVTGCVGDQEDAEIYESLIAKLDRSYACYRDVLKENGLFEAPCGHRDTRIKPTAFDDEGMHGEGRVCVELTDVKEMPFDMDATCSAAWRCITSGYMQLQHELYRGFEGADDILAVSYAVTMTRKRVHVDMAARAVMKKFVDGDRIVFVWESISDTDGSHCASSEKPGIQVEERGWTVFSRQVDTDGSAMESTRIRTCMQMRPLVSPADSDEGRQVGLLTNLTLDNFGEQLEQAHQGIESLLLDERK